MVRSLPDTIIQLGLVLQAAVVIVAEKLSAKLNTCERAMKAACSAGKIGCKVLMKLRGVEVRETVCGLLYGTRLGEIAREALPVVSFVFPGVWHVRCHVNQSDN
jgi:hypothetical protein